MAQPLLSTGAREGTPREEVGKMGYIILGIAYAVLAIVEMVKLGPGHA